jgi:hypothetical protein
MKIHFQEKCSYVIICFVIISGIDMQYNEQHFLTDPFSCQPKLVFYHYLMLNCHSLTLFLCILQKPKPPPVEKAAVKPSAKAPAKKGKQEASTSVEEPDEPPLSPTSEKIRQQRYMLFLWPVNFLDTV